MRVNPKILSSFFLITVLVLFGFTSQSPLYSIDSFQPSPSANVLEGKKIMEAKCIRCHALKVVKDYPLEKWDKVLPKMAKKAKITPLEQEKISTFVRWQLQQTK